ncbi:MBL fold metallo-hydrolase [Nocardiopsis sp. RSe5-2]|uniref:MBL fold metallo-hydrolase n=1 Tax=Nocardiopsis endophytica TaxID=3018445 RepID=A0ABT4UF13_9ACTN|nr:MBL fold metallo-hydrolase [Nocardiopsis endophytica]MDA2815074.1 MBL fold metallo-hydrolase [Nocardiopsis endophytica]
MRIEKRGHACVRLTHGGGTLVIDPGGLSEPDAAVGADAVALTHEHGDHFDADRLHAALKANPDLEIHTHAGIAEKLGPLADLGARVVVHAHGDTARIAGFDVDVYGERHAVIHPDIPVITNIGFRVATPSGAVFHPGDSFTVPEDPVTTLLVPVHAPWSKTAEVVDYLRAVAPRSALAVHDGLLNDTGAGAVELLVSTLAPDVDYARLEPGRGRDLD